MTNNTASTIGLIPTFIHSAVIQKNEKGEYHWTPEWQNNMTQLLQSLNQVLSKEGTFAPQQPTATITQLNTARSTGAFVYDSDTDEMKVNINGTFKTVQVV